MCKVLLYFEAVEGLLCTKHTKCVSAYAGHEREDLISGVSHYVLRMMKSYLTFYRLFPCPCSLQARCNGSPNSPDFEVAKNSRKGTGPVIGRFGLSSFTKRWQTSD